MNNDIFDLNEPISSTETEIKLDLDTVLGDSDSDSDNIESDSDNDNDNIDNIDNIDNNEDTLGIGNLSFDNEKKDTELELELESELEPDKVLDMTEWKELDYINIFTIHFNKIEGKIKLIFDNIDYDTDDSTNRCLEYIYDHMHKYNTRENESIAELVLGESGELGEHYHKLYIDDTLIYSCELLYPLIVYLSTLEWWNIDWIIDH